MPAPHAIDPASNGEHHWWALYTRHQHEKVVADVLSAKGFEVFLPLYDSIRRWRDRQKLLSLPLFPCYVFVHGGLNRRFQILNTPGVHMALTHGDRIAVIPESRNRRRFAGRLKGLSAWSLIPFSDAEIGCGWSGARSKVSEGILIRKKNQFRLVLSVDMLAKSVAVEIDASDVESIVEPVPIRQTSEMLYTALQTGVASMHGAAGPLA